MSYKIVCGIAAVFGTVVFFNIPIAFAQISEADSLTPTGIYAQMPGQPGAPPAYLANYPNLPPIPISEPKPIVIENAAVSLSAPLPDVMVIQAAVPATVPPPGSGLPANADSGSLTEPTPQSVSEPAAEQPAPSGPPVYYHPPQKQTVQLAMSPFMTLETRQGVDVGVQISDYRYHEPGTGAKISGVNYGGLLGGTVVVGDHFFGTAEGRFSAGWDDYSSTLGQIHNRPDTLWDARGLVGKDLIFEYFDVSPYSGFGYRHLNNDLRGTTSTGTSLYERDDGIYYVPFGMHTRARLDQTSRLAASLEYDFLVEGLETSHLGDLGTGNPNVRNEQNNGYGFRAEVMYETPYWSFGPFGNYWSLQTTNPSVYHSPGSTCGSANCSLTGPYSRTIEAGVQLKFHFF